MERLPPPPAALLPPIADLQRISYERTLDQQRTSYERTSDLQRASYERTLDQQRVPYERTSEQQRTSADQQQLLASSFERSSPLSNQQRASLIRSLSDRLTDFQQEEKHQVPSPPLRLHSAVHTHLRKQFEGGGKAGGFGQQHQHQGGGGQVYPTGKPLHGPI